ncbi:MAG: PadR family transcriptional regulator [Clostridiaceae bacterium]
MEKSYREMEKELQEEYKKKLNLLKKVKSEKEAVGQVFTKGILPLYVYYILAQAPSNGNDIATKITQHTGGKWSPSTGGIYPLLKKMEKQGFITGLISDEGRLQKIYTLTKSGEEEFSYKKDLLFEKIKDAVDVFRLVLTDIYELNNEQMKTEFDIE